MKRLSIPFLSFIFVSAYSLYSNPLTLAGSDRALFAQVGRLTQTYEILFVGLFVLAFIALITGLIIDPKEMKGTQKYYPPI